MCRQQLCLLVFTVTKTRRDSRYRCLSKGIDYSLHVMVQWALCHCFLLNGAPIAWDRKGGAFAIFMAQMARPLNCLKAALVRVVNVDNNIVG